MQKTLWILALGACAVSSAALADELVMPQATSAVEAESPDALIMPAKGQSMAAVTKAFGQPKTQHKPAGGDTPKHPAITRWDYENFSVFFERGKVIDSVNHGKPADLHHTEELKPLDY